jgi:Putative prokaryotic signal transducing protein
VASAEGPLACPRCARTYGLDERFCSECGMPLVHVGRGDEEPITEVHERARKVKPQYTGGQLVKIAGGRHQAEAEMIQGMLLEHGIPSVQRRTRGFDVPDFLAAGPRDIMVPEAAAEDAHALLAETTPEGDDAPGAPPPAAVGGEQKPGPLLVGMLIAVAVAALIVWALYQLVT